MTSLRGFTYAIVTAALVAGSAHVTRAQCWVEPIDPIRYEDVSIYFAAGSAVLSDDAKATLDRQAKILLAYPSYKAVTYGYSDPYETPSRQAAWDLGLARAIAARDNLISKGVSPDRLRPDSHGYESVLFTGDIHDEPVTLAHMRMVTTAVQLPPGRWKGLKRDSGCGL